MLFSFFALTSIASAQIAMNVGFYTSAPDSDDACSGLLGNVTVKVQSLDDCQVFGFSDATLVADGTNIVAVDGQFQFWSTQDCTGDTVFKIVDDSNYECDDFVGTGVESLTVNGMGSKGYVSFDLSGKKKK